MNEISRSNRINNVLSLQVARNARQPRGGSNVHNFIPAGLSVNQRLLERLEAENAQLRGNAVDLLLQIQALHGTSGTKAHERHGAAGLRSAG
jgi:hypothetical protein